MERRIFILLGLLACAAAVSPAKAESCPGNPEALGTSRVLALDTSHGLEIGKQYGHTLPLGRKEIVLTFDDGPLPATSARVRKLLEAECIHATFFLIGRNAAAHPEFVRELAADGHTIASHTMNHPLNLRKKPFEYGVAEVDSGIAAVNAALSGSPDQPEVAPFFRFPGLGDTAALRAMLRERGIGVISIDIEAGDWFARYKPSDVLNRVMKQLDKEQRGIILLHDVQERTVEMLPEFIRRLKAEHYKIVHIVPANRAGAENVQLASVGPQELIPAVPFDQEAVTERRMAARARLMQNNFALRRSLPAPAGGLGIDVGASKPLSAPLTFVTDAKYQNLVFLVPHKNAGVLDEHFSDEKIRPILIAYAIPQNSKPSAPPRPAPPSVQVQPTRSLFERFFMVQP